jgi:hypothetical protein
VDAHAGAVAGSTGLPRAYDASSHASPQPVQACNSIVCGRKQRPKAENMGKSDVKTLNFNPSSQF